MWEEKKRHTLPVTKSGFNFPSCLRLLREGMSSSSTSSSSSSLAMSSILTPVLPEKSEGPRVSFSPSC